MFYELLFLYSEPIMKRLMLEKKSKFYKKVEKKENSEISLLISLKVICSYVCNFMMA